MPEPEEGEPPSEPQQNLVNKGLLKASAAFAELKRQVSKGAKWAETFMPFYDPTQLKLSTAQKLVYIKGNSTSKDSGEAGALVSVAGGED